MDEYVLTRPTGWRRRRYRLVEGVGIMGQEPPRLGVLLYRLAGNVRFVLVLFAIICLVLITSTQHVA